MSVQNHRVGNGDAVAHMTEMSFTFENTKPEISNHDLLEDLKRVSLAVGQDSLLTERTYQREGKYVVITFQKRFGSWRAAVMAAGLESGNRRDISDDELFDNLR
jgi:hypothetical protein